MAASNNSFDYNENPNKDKLIKKLMETVSNLQKKFQEEDDEEKQWLINNSNNPDVIKLLKEMTVMMLHVLDAIGQLEPVNGITISKQFGIPKGSVSKISRKLLQTQIIRKEFLPGNKKEILFRTTPLGKEIFHLHKALHRQIDKGAYQFLKRYNSSELHFLIQCLQDTLDASWVNTDVQKEPIVGQTEKERSNVQLNYTKELCSAIKSQEINDIVDMLITLDTGNLKKAKKILKDVFFTSFDE
ncbi:MarR family transcriptional regulator [Bacillus sp. 03113]|uniref:MarR family transcriptional regulator n=1 Tax=Bacillus sp. 03113 TaxID=2578211 RepID=UPI00114502C2|nr:MarR family transcriptional regulator [Bacillus sp. 03113]